MPTPQQELDAMRRVLAQQKAQGALDCDDLERLETEHCRCQAVAVDGGQSVKSDEYSRFIQWCGDEDAFLVRTFQNRADELQSQGWPRLWVRLIEVRRELKDLESLFLK